ncbi:MAG: D-alanyl-D-alanine carboxypeptidase/D-alanyl-D-alanine-endopeptidase [Gammaproteobacteria bacterium]
MRNQIALLKCTLLVVLYAVTGAVALAQAPAKPVSTIPAELNKHLEKLGIPLDSVSLSVQKLGAEESLVNVHSSVPRNPASVMKMLTTYAALAKLGPGYQWETELRRTGLAEGGVLRGDLIIVGRGNPMFLQQDLWSMVNHLDARGIRSIAGDLIIDSSYFDLPDHDSSAFDGKGYRPYNAGPDAALFNFSSVDFSLVPQKGKEFVDVRVAPHIRGMEIESTIKQLNGDCRGNRIKLRLDVEQLEASRKVKYSGHYPRSCGRYQLTRAVLPSTELLYGTLSSIMASRGGELTGGLLIGRAPKGSSKLLTLSSKTLSEIVRSTNKFSNNVMSRQLFLTLGAETYGKPATPGKGENALKAVLSEEGVDTDSLIVANGSGLCRQCRVTVDTLMQTLDAAWQSIYMPEFVASLGVPGIDGSLKKRFPKGSYKGRVHMKTGTIDHVSAAAGYVQSKSNERYKFALVINHENVHKGKGNAFQRKLMSWIVNQ